MEIWKRGIRGSEKATNTVTRNSVSVWVKTCGKIPQVLVLCRAAKKNHTEVECEGGACGEVCGSYCICGECKVVFDGCLGLRLDGAARSWENEL